MPTEPPSGDSKAVRELLQQVTVARYFAGQSGAESKEPNRNENKQNLQESHSRCAFMTGLYSWDERVKPSGRRVGHGQRQSTTSTAS
ncbi:hypothetical protein FRC19_007589 [Serendipita sp. 401]|nr:hypothetical protein FRC19_007589 [Serendipita sp. 401]